MLSSSNASFCGADAQGIGVLASVSERPCSLMMAVPSKAKSLLPEWGPQLGLIPAACKARASPDLPVTPFLIPVAGCPPWAQDHSEEQVIEEADRRS